MNDTTQTTLPLKPKYTKEFIKGKLSCDPRWAVRGLIRIFQFQTEQEQSVGETVESNDVGFNGADAAILTSFAKHYQKYGWLSDKQMVIVFKKMPKYSSQLLGLIEGKQ